MKTSWTVGIAAVVLAASAWAQTVTAGGEVTKLDIPAARVTLKHTGIKNLDMPPMTMAFRVRDAKMLDGLVVGDQVRFAAERVDGQYLLVSLTRAP